MKKRIEIIEASYRRNGIGGEGFYAILFRDNEEVPGKTMIASFFDEPGYCAVYCVEELAAGNITFAHGNSWRGDHYKPMLKPLLKEYLEREGTNRMGPFAFPGVKPTA